MKKSTFITLFITVHIASIFMQIHKHMEFIKQSFAKQKNERLLEDVRQKKQELINQLHVLKNRSSVKEFAANKLQMKPVRLHQIKQWNNNDQCT